MPFTPSSVRVTARGCSARFSAYQQGLGSPAASIRPQPAPTSRSRRVQTRAPAQGEAGRRHSAKVAAMTSPVTSRDRSR